MGGMLEVAILSALPLENCCRNSASRTCLEELRRNSASRAGVCMRTIRRCSLEEEGEPSCVRARTLYYRRLRRAEEVEWVGWRWAAG